MATGLAQGQDASLRQGARGAAAAGAAEGPLVGWGVGQIDDEPIQGHGRHPAVEGARGGGFALQADDLLGPQSHRGDAETLPGLAERGAWRDRSGSERRKPAEDLAVTIATEQAQGDHEPDQEPARQPAAAGPVVAGSGQDFFNASTREDTFQRAGSLGRGPGRE